MKPDKTEKMAIDMQKLADLAGVSRSTVSRALADSPLVNDKTKERIQQLAREHNYVLNEAARNLRLRQSRTVCVVLMMDKGAEQRMSDPFFLEMMGCLADSLVDAGYDMLLRHTAIDKAEEFRNSSAYRQSEGILIIGQGRAHDELNALADAERPIVVWGAQRDDAKYCIVGSDNRGGAYAAAQHLLQAGRRSLAFFGDRSLPEPLARYEGFTDAMRESGIAIDPSNVLDVPFESERAAAVIGDYLDRAPAIDGIVCCSDVIAVTALAQLGPRGRKVPSDVAVIGYDNIDLARRASPPLCTVDQHIPDGGRLMVQKLFELIGGNVVTGELLEASLIVRESSGA